MAVVVDIEGTTGARGQGVPVVSLYVLDKFGASLRKDLDKVFFPENGQDFTDDHNTVTYTHYTGEVGNYPLIVDNPTTTQNLNAQAEIINRKPQFRMAEHRLLRPMKKGDKVILRGVLYYVDVVENDGVGVVTAYLRRK